MVCYSLNLVREHIALFRPPFPALVAGLLLCLEQKCLLLARAKLLKIPYILSLNIAICWLLDILKRVLLRSYRK